MTPEQLAHCYVQKGEGFEFGCVPGRWQISEFRGRKLDSADWAGSGFIMITWDAVESRRPPFVFCKCVCDPRSTLHRWTRKIGNRRHVCLMDDTTLIVRKVTCLICQQIFMNSALVLCVTIQSFASTTTGSIFVTRLIKTILGSKISNVVSKTSSGVHCRVCGANPT